MLKLFDLCHIIDHDAVLTIASGLPFFGSTQFVASIVRFDLTKVFGQHGLSDRFIEFPYKTGGKLFLIICQKPLVQERTKSFDLFIGDVDVI